MKNADTFHLLGFSSVKSLRTLLCVSLEGEPGPAPKMHYCFLAVPPLSLHPLPSWINNCSNVPFGTQGKSWRLESRNRGQKGLHAQDPHRVLLCFNPRLYNKTVTKIDIEDNINIWTVSKMLQKISHVYYKIN